MLNVTKHYKWSFSVSSLLVIASIAVLFVWGLNPGIDFTGGALAELSFDNEVDTNEIRDLLLSAGFSDVVVQPINDKEVIIKTEPLNTEMREKFVSTLSDNFGQFEEQRFESIGPTIGNELKRDAFWQIALVIIGIVLYIAYAFRRISKISKETRLSSWKLGGATIVALVHDVLITIAVFSVLGNFFGVEIDTLFVTALLTILGFSVHDTIVVFDRIRENMQKHKHLEFNKIVDFSVDSTLARSINTSSTLIFVLIALLLFGGNTIFYFVLALLIGVLAGTYSSIFLASPLLSVWRKK